MHESPHNLDKIWWLHPGLLLLLFTLPLYLLIAVVVPAFFPELIVLRSASYMTSEMTLLGLGCLATLCVAALLGGRVAFRSAAPHGPYVVNEMFLFVIGLLTLVAYLIWFAPVVARGTLSLEREDLNQMPGITSLSQLGVPFVTCFVYAKLRARQRLSLAVELLFWSILAFTLFRVYVWSERLALIEVGVAGAVMVLCYARPRKNWTRRSLLLVGTAGPLLGLPLLLGFFMATELVRSWSSTYYQSQDLNFLDFMVSRLVTYYYTALNNGAGILATSSWPDDQYTYVLNWGHRLPFGIGGLFASLLGGSDSPTWEFLDRYGDAEFNNPSGIFPIVYDLGVTLAIFYFGIIGFAAGMIYRELRRGSPWGVMLFAPFFVAMLEVLRILYLNETRCFVIIMASLFAVTQFRPRGHATRWRPLPFVAPAVTRPSPTSVPVTRAPANPRSAVWSAQG